MGLHVICLLIKCVLVFLHVPRKCALFSQNQSFAAVMHIHNPSYSLTPAGQNSLILLHVLYI